MWVYIFKTLCGLKKRNASAGNISLSINKLFASKQQEKCPLLCEERGSDSKGPLSITESTEWGGGDVPGPFFIQYIWGVLMQQTVWWIIIHKAHCFISLPFKKNRGIVCPNYWKKFQWHSSRTTVRQASACLLIYYIHQKLLIITDFTYA